MKVKPLHQYKNNNPMGAKEAQWFLSMTMHDLSENNAAYPVNDLEPVLSEFFESALPFPTRIFLSHLGTHSPQTKLSIGAVGFLALEHIKTPGDAVMWAYSVHRISEEYDFKKSIDLSTLAKFYPYGFPSEEVMEKAWDEQKGGNNIGGNLLDDPETWYEKRNNMNFNLPLTEEQGQFVYNVLSNHISGPACAENGLFEILETMRENNPYLFQGSSPIPFSKHPLYKDGILYLDEANGQTDLEPVGNDEYDFVIDLSEAELEVLGRALGSRKPSHPDFAKSVDMYKDIVEVLGHTPESKLSADEDELEEMEGETQDVRIQSDGKPENHAIFVDDNQLKAIMVGLKRNMYADDHPDYESEYLYSFLENIFGDVEIEEEDTEAFGDGYVANEGEVGENGVSYYLIDGVPVPVYDGEQYDEDEYFDNLPVQYEGDGQIVMTLSQLQFETLGSILYYHIAGPAIHETGLDTLARQMDDVFGIMGYDGFAKMEVQPNPFLKNGDTNPSWLVLKPINENEEN